MVLIQWKTPPKKGNQVQKILCIKSLSRDEKQATLPLDRVGKVKFPVYVFGYGSLLFPNGWNKRGMIKKYDNKDLKTCWLNNYKRGLYGRYGNILYYGIIPNKDCRCNGIVTKVYNEYDYIKLMLSERAKQVIETYFPFDKNPINYYIDDVTDNIKFDRKVSNENLRVHAVINNVNDPNRKHSIPEIYYLAYVWSGIEKYRSKRFIKEFTETGGLNYEEVKKLYKLFRKEVDLMYWL